MRTCPSVQGDYYIICYYYTIKAAYLAERLGLHHPVSTKQGWATAAEVSVPGDGSALASTWQCTRLDSWHVGGKCWWEL